MEKMFGFVMMIFAKRECLFIRSCMAMSDQARDGLISGYKTKH